MKGYQVKWVSGFDLTERTGEVVANAGGVYVVQTRAGEVWTVAAGNVNFVGPPSGK